LPGWAIPDVMHYTSIWRLMLIALINKIFNSRTRKKGLEP